MLQNSLNRNSIGIFFGLVLLMLLTRTNHFGSVNFLPDASLAIFFFAGMYLRRLMFPLFLLLAGFIDYVVIKYGAVSSWCITPGYLFLIPTYAVMWETGRFAYRKFLSNQAENALHWLAYAKVVACVFLATTAAFFVSNYGFYAFSERFDSMGFFDYFAAVAKYLPSYLSSTVLYSLVLLVVHAFVQTQVQSKPGQVADKY